MSSEQGANERCEWCGGDADPATTCRGPCYRPSGHRAPELHASRVRMAESESERQLAIQPDGTLAPQPASRKEPETFEQDQLFHHEPTIKGQLAMQDNGGAG